MVIASLILFRNSVDTINLLIIFIGLNNVLNFIIMALDSLNRFFFTVAIKSLDCARVLSNLFISF